LATENKTNSSQFLKNQKRRESVFYELEINQGALSRPTFPQVE